MREIYSKVDLKNSLLSIANNDEISHVLLESLLYAKLKRIQEEYQEVYKIYERHKPIIERNVNREIKDYDVQPVMIKAMNKNTEKLLKLQKSKDFYTKIFNSSLEGVTNDKRRKILISLIEKSI